MKLLFSKSIRLELSKTVPIILLRPLVMILCSFEVSKFGQKNRGGGKKKTSQLHFFGTFFGGGSASRPWFFGVIVINFGRQYWEENKTSIVFP